VNEQSTINQLEGGPALSEWLGITPSFHDATLLALEIRQGGTSLLQARTFIMGPEVDDEGYYILTRRAVVTFSISGLVEAELYEFTDGGVLDGLAVHVAEDGVELCWDAAYGVHGRLKAKAITVTFEPG
jgi:hypothetical protein